MALHQTMENYSLCDGISTIIAKADENVNNQ